MKTEVLISGGNPVWKQFYNFLQNYILFLYAPAIVLLVFFFFFFYNGDWKHVSTKSCTFIRTLLIIINSSYFWISSCDACRPYEMLFSTTKKCVIKPWQEMGGKKSLLQVEEVNVTILYTVWSQLWQGIPILKKSKQLSQVKGQWLSGLRKSKDELTKQNTFKAVKLFWIII